MQWAFKPAAIVAALMLCGSERAEAVVMPDGSNESAYLELGAQYEGRFLTLKANYSGSPNPAYRSAVYLNEYYALTAAHAVDEFFTDPNATFEIGNGTNYLSSRGTVVAADSIIMYPGYVADPNGDHPLPDLAIIHFAESLSGTPATIASVTEDQIVTAVGIGDFGTPSTGVFPNDGKNL